MTKVLYDLIAAQSSLDIKFHGGGQYAKGLIVNACKKGYTNFECVYDSSRYIDHSLIKLLNELGIKIHDVKGNAGLLKELVESSRYTMFYSALPTLEHRRYKYKDTIFAFTIHGLRNLEQPKDFYVYKYDDNLKKKTKNLIKHWLFPGLYYRLCYKRYKNLLSLKNTKIFTVSEHSKWSIRYYFPENMNKKIEVFHSPFFFVEQSISDKPIPEKDYYLIVSSNRWVKNSYRAIKAFDKLFDKNYLKGKKVVLLGGSKKIGKFVKNKNRFIIKNYVADEELNAYMKNAYALVYPTLNEGFGYPPTQAMYYGTPVVTSLTSSIGEICQNAVLYFNPYSIDEIANRILQIDSDLTLREDLLNKGKERFRELYELQKEQEQKMLDAIFG